MKVGIFAKTWAGSADLETLFRAAYAYDIESFQFNMCLAGGETLPEKYDVEVVERIRELSQSYGIEIAAMSGTFNLLDKKNLAENLEKAEILFRICKELSTPVLSVCTGTRSEESMWSYHPDNDTKESWEQMKEHMHQLIAIAEKYPVHLGVEPEISNVVSSAQKAKQLLCECNHSSVKIILDAANLFRSGEKKKMREKIKEATVLLGNDIVLAHAKDCVITEGVVYKAPGKGDIDFEFYSSCLKEIQYSGSFILHGLEQAEVLECVQFIKRQLMR